MKSVEELLRRIEGVEADAEAPAREIVAALHLDPKDRPDLAVQRAALRRRQAAAAKLVAETRRQSALAAHAGTAGHALQEAVREARTRMTLWDRINDAVDDCCAGLVWPLMPEPRPRHDVGAVQASAVAKILTDAHVAANRSPQDLQARDHGCFADIPLDSARFVRSAHLASRLLLARRQPRPHGFLDVGCGGGMKVALAAEFFDRAHGLDYDSGYVETALANFAVMHAERCDAFVADGLHFEGYGGYDVIYFYRPMRQEEGQRQLERQIVDGCRPGTILIAPYTGFQERFGALGCQHVLADVYLRDSDEAVAVALTEAARRIGPHALHHGRGAPRVAGWLKPLWHACLANGIRPEE